MKDIATIKKDLESNKELTKSIENLVKQVVISSKFTFEEKELSFEFDLLKATGEILFEDNKWKVALTDNFLYSIYKYFEEKENFHLSNNFQETVTFIIKIQDYFKDKGYISGLSALINRLWKLLIISTNLMTASDFSEYIFKLTKTIDKLQKPVKLTIQNRSKLTTYLAGEIFSTVSDLDC